MILPGSATTNWSSQRPETSFSSILLLPSAYGHQFTKGRINSILRNRRYIGEYKYGDIVVPGGIPAIIDQELFDRVNKKIDYKRMTKSYIGECGNAHYSGRKYNYYKCGGAKRNKCSHGTGIRKNWIERLVFRVTVDIVLDDKMLDLIAESIFQGQNKEDPAIPGMRQQLADCKKRISNLMKTWKNTGGYYEELK